MRTVTFKSVRNSVLRRMGLDAAQPVLGSQAAALADYIQTALSDVWGLYDWPDTTVTGTVTPVGTTIAHGTTIGAMLRITDKAPAATTLVQHFQFEESADSTSTEITDTRYNAGDQVHIKYRTPEPLFTGEDYSASATYAPGDVVYFDTTGDCYLCILAATGIAPTTATHWVRQRIPAIFSNHLKATAHAATLEEDGQYDKAQFQLTKAEAEIIKAHDDVFFRQNNTPLTWSLQRDPTTPY